MFLGIPYLVVEESLISREKLEVVYQKQETIQRGIQVMNKKEFYLLNHLYNTNKGREKVLKDLYLDQILKSRTILRELIKKGFIDEETGDVTDLGMIALEPYKVSNAVILAAGASTRFIPLSLEQPKGLYEVKGEKLIERQIKQLIEAGITDITVVLGYKKEMLFYLKEKYNVKFIFNTSYNIKNNIESLYLARHLLGNTYICSCDNYFIENPFNQYEYQTFYAGFDVEKKTNEMYVYTDEENRIINMKKGLNQGQIVMGHSFWQKDFSESFISLAEADREVGVYNNSFWEWLVKENLVIMPAIYIKPYPQNSIFEFDYFEELRDFDDQYVGNARSEIIRNIKLVFRCDEEDIVDFRNVNEGMTNMSFIFKINGIDYIYRHPGDGTESIINRKNEKISLEKVKQIGIDPTYIYMDVNEGWKISKFVNKFREPDYSNFDDSKKILSTLRELHNSPVKVDYGMKPWEDALDMEQLLLKKDQDCFREFEVLKSKISVLYQKTINDGVKKCFCHGDTYKTNWMIKDDGEVILIDWEYSGYSDPGIDVGYYIVDAMYDFDEAKNFIREYLGDNYSDVKEFHFLAYVAIIAYYWFVWALYRESCGAVMGEALFNWYEMANKYADYMLEDI